MTQDARVQDFVASFEGLRAEVEKVIVGHREIIDHVLVGLFAGGHVLLEGVPGLGKTLLIKTLAEGLELSFSRVQFTPDLMPADIIGTNIIVEDAGGRKHFQFQQGPIFAHIVLADEINRATPKTQSALLEGHAGGGGHRGRRRRGRCRRPSSSWPRRTRSRWRAPTRCPRPSSTASCSSCACAIPPSRS